jgi:hypothetical protein
LSENGGNCLGCEWIRASGEITETTADALETLLKEFHHALPNHTVLLDSPGGSLIGAIKLGEAIRKQLEVAAFRAGGLLLPPARLVTNVIVLHGAKLARLGQTAKVSI